MSNDSSEWGCDVEKVLEDIKNNSIILSNEHKERFLSLQKRLRYFKIPCILLSSVNAVFSVSLSAFINQDRTSMLCSFISLITTIITSTEMYLSIEKSMISELDVSRSYYLLSVDIAKTLRLDRVNRTIEANTFLDSCVNQYKNLFSSSCVLDKKIRDSLVIFDSNDHLNTGWKPSSDELDIERSGNI